MLRVATMLISVTVILEPLVGWELATPGPRTSVISGLPTFPRLSQVYIYRPFRMGKMNSWLSWSPTTMAEDRTLGRGFIARRANHYTAKVIERRGATEFWRRENQKSFEELQGFGEGRSCKRGESFLEERGAANVQRREELQSFGKSGAANFYRS